MATSPGLFFWQDKLGKANPHCVQFLWQITAAQTISQIPQGTPVLTTFAAIASQSTIDDFLGTTNEFLIAQFDATAMGVDSFGCIVNMAKQADELYAAEAFFDNGTLVQRVIPSVATLTSSSLSTQAAVGSYGNLAMRAVLTGLDAATSGILGMNFYFRSK
jgi:hypothetical protein